MSGTHPAAGIARTGEESDAEISAPVSEAAAALLAGEFCSLAERFAESKDTQDALQRLVNLAPQVIEGCRWAGITQYSKRDGFVTAAASSPTTVMVDRLQYSVHEGPCVAAVEADGSYSIPDLTTDVRWPRFSALTAAHSPVRSALSLTIGPATPRAALNLYGPHPSAFQDEDLDVSILFATHAHTLLRFVRATRQIADLERALTSSRLIGTAIGILMYAHKTTADESFQRLVASSQRLNRKLADIAETVTRTGELPAERAECQSARSAESHSISPATRASNWLSCGWRSE